MSWVVHGFKAGLHLGVGPCEIGGNQSGAVWLDPVRERLQISEGKISDASEMISEHL